MIFLLKSILTGDMCCQMGCSSVLQKLAVQLLLGILTIDYECVDELAQLLNKVLSNLRVIRGDRCQLESHVSGIL